MWCHASTEGDEEKYNLIGRCLLSDMDRAAAVPAATGEALAAGARGELT